MAKVKALKIETDISSYNSCLKVYRSKKRKLYVWFGIGESIFNDNTILVKKLSLKEFNQIYFNI